jgi:hypothetical protein
MRRALPIFALLATFVVGGCSSQSPEEKAAEDAAEALGELFGAISGSTQDTVHKETVKGWPDKFCSLKTNMGKDEVRSIMGEPTQIFADSNANQDQWEGYDYSLTVFYDIDDMAMQLQSNRDNVPCESTRFRD